MGIGRRMLSGVVRKEATGKAKKEVMNTTVSNTSLHRLKYMYIFIKSSKHFIFRINNCTGTCSNTNRNIDNTLMVHTLNNKET